MTTVSSWAVDERVYAEVKRLCAAGLDAPTLHRRALSSIARAVPFDGACAHAADPSSGLVARMYLDPPDERAGRFFLEHVYFEEDMSALNNLLRARRQVARLSETAGGDMRRSLRYRAALAPRGFHFDLRAVYTQGGEHWGGVSLLRARGAPDFDEREAALVGRLAPHLGAGLRAAALRAQAAAAPADDEAGAGVLVLDRRGRVRSHTAAAERWLRELDALGPGWLDGDGLPAAVWLAVGALRHALAVDAAGTRRIAAQTRTGRWLHLEAALAEPREGHGQDTIIVVEPAGPRALGWLRTAAYGLTAREREVVELVVRGASTRSIAAALVITEDTVQDHLSHIFDKAGVRGRRALVRRLYLDGLDAAASPVDPPIER
jgi:DNA-binding CsgD family transcriptional regulator